MERQHMERMKEECSWLKGGWRSRDSTVASLLLMPGQLLRWASRIKVSMEYGKKTIHQSQAHLSDGKTEIREN